MTTPKEACEFLSAITLDELGISVDPVSLFNYSPRGELSDLIFVYNAAKDLPLDSPKRLDVALAVCWLMRISPVSPTTPPPPSKPAIEQPRPSDGPSPE